MYGKKLFGAVLLMVIGMVAGYWGWGFVQGNQTALAESTPDSNKCELHNIAINQCTRCYPELIAEFKTRGDWCAEHNLPESQCDLCGLTDETGHQHDDHGEESAGETHEHDSHKESSIIEASATNKSLSENKVRPDFISVIFPENSTDCVSDKAIIQLASIETAGRIGLTTQTAVSSAPLPDVEAPAEIIFDESRSAVIASTITAMVKKWQVEPGQPIAGGTALASLDSPEMPRLKAEYIEASADWQLLNKKKDRDAELLQKQLISDSQYDDILAEYQVAEAHLIGIEGILKAAGVSPSDLELILAEKNISSDYTYYSSADGILVDRIARPGVLLQAGEALAHIADPNSLWIEARVNEYDADRIKVGMEMEFTSDGKVLGRCLGEIIWIARFLDRETHTVTVRAKVLSSSESLFEGQFGRALIYTNEDNQAILIPKDAVQWEGCCNIVFVKNTPDRYFPRKIDIKPAGGDYYRVVTGLSGGEEIVVAGSYLLKAELRKNRLGIGCAGHLH